MPTAYLIFLVANVVYGTSYVATRITLQEGGPATLAVVRLGIGAVILMPLAVVGLPARHRLTRADRWRVCWMGLLGFAAAFAFANWGSRGRRRPTPPFSWNWVLERVKAPRLAIVINVQPVVGALLGAWWLREPLTTFTVIGGALVLVGLHVAPRSGRMV